MTVGVALLGPESRPDFKDPFQATAHAQLLEQLRRLIQEGRPVKVLHRKQIGAAFGGGGHDFWRVGFDEAFRNEVFSAELQHFPSQPEHRVDVRAAQVEETVVKAGVQFNLDRIGHAKRQRGFGSSNDVHRGGQHLVSGRGGRLAIFDLRWSLEGHGSCELKRGFSRHPLHGVERFFADVVGFEKDLSVAGAVPQVNKADRPFSSVCLHEADDGDFLVEKVGSVGLEFAQRVRSVCGGNPSGHVWGAAVENMKHSLGWLGSRFHSRKRQLGPPLASCLLGESESIQAGHGPKSLEEHRLGSPMASQRARAVSCVAVLLLMGLAPMAMTVGASSTVLLSSDAQHVVLEPGQSTNITLTVENNGSSITSYNLTLDDGGLSSVWDIAPVDDVVTNVFPTWSKNTTVVVRLLEGATVADSGSFTLTATDTSTNENATHEVYVSVAPAYHPSLEADGSARVNLAAGSSVNLTYTATNLGTVTDTFLLDVEVEPDLSGWWANQTNGSSNGNGSNATTPSVSVLMYGNSYTASNGLAGMVESVVDSAGYNSTVSSLTGGGMRLPQHWQNLNTSSHQWNTTLRGSSWDYAVLQDQSQVPSFPTTESMWLESRNASVDLAGAISDEGAETVLFMTWGYRDGDSSNAFNNNFSTMQARLAEGYTRYAENISAAGHAVWMAPVGLAYKTVHDAVVANGDDPTTSGNLFHDLYASDGSHPSLAGSYLASCVLHATLTGETCAGNAASVNLNATTKRALEEAADDTVFNQTAGMSYYPWETGGTAAFGLGGSVPSGWYLQWAEDEVTMLAAGASQSATLSLTVPADAAPDFYGYRLTVGSTNGNITTSTLLVVEVLAEADAALAFLDQAADFLPGQSTVTSVQVTNTGNTPLDLDWAVETPSTDPCSVAMHDAQTLDLLPEGVTTVALQVDVASEAMRSDTCEITLTAHVAVNDATEVLEQLVFAINVDERVNFSLSGPAAPLRFEPMDGATYEVRVHNDGSDEATFYLDPEPVSGLQTVLVSASGVTVAPGEIGLWTVNTKGNIGEAGSFAQGFSSTYGGVTKTATVDVDLLEVPSFSLAGPGEDRLLIAPGGTATMNLTLANTGTANVSLVSLLSGLPAGVTATLSHPSITLNTSASVEVVLTVDASPGVSPASHDVMLAYNGNDVSASFGFDLVIVERNDVVANAVNNLLLATPTQTTELLVDVTNIGTQADVYVVDWVAELEGSWYDFTIAPTTFQLSSGATQTVSITVREVGQGAPSGGVNHVFTVASANDASSNDALNITVQSVVANANLTVLVEQASAKPGENVFGSVVVTNTGASEDTFSITTVGTDCGLDATVTLAPGLSSPSLGWSCVVPNDASAGQRGLVFRAVSAVRSNIAVEQVSLYTVEADFPGGTLVDLVFEDTRLSLGVDSSSSTVLKVRNLANAEVTGSLEILGEETGVLLVEWTRLSDQTSTNAFTLSSGSTVEFKLTLISNTARAASAEVVVRSTAAGAGVTTSDQSLPLSVTVEGPALPPNGLALPLGLSVSQPLTLSVMGLGWLIALVSVRRLRSRSDGDEAEKLFQQDDEDEVEDEPEEAPELGYNECRMDGESKVNCPTCDARLGVPRGSTPPFRFTCPTCSNKIRVVE